MARLEIRITHVAWRDGRPRFQPGPWLRKLGFKGEDLRRADGGWMSAEEALAWAAEREKTIAARRVEAAAAAIAGTRLRKFTIAGRPLFSTEDLIEAWFRENPKMRPPDQAPAPAGPRRIKPLTAASLKSYRYFASVLGTFDGHIYTAPVEALTKEIVFDLYERLAQARGLATARGVIATLSAAISWGMKKGKARFHVNPCHKLGMETPPPRVRCWTPAEVAAFVAAADAAGRPEIGDAVVLGCWTGQRQGDRLALVDVGLQDGRRVFRQSKTGALVAIPPAPALEARLRAARARREAWPAQPLTLIVDERTRRPFKGMWYSHVFAAVRRTAVEACPSLADATDQDLRDTAVTWLARAGATLFEICAITGHSLQSATTVLRHYVAQHPELADNAMAKLVPWFESQAQSPSANI